MLLNGLRKSWAIIEKNLFLVSINSFNLFSFSDKLTTNFWNLSSLAIKVSSAFFRDVIPYIGTIASFCFAFLFFTILSNLLSF